MSSSFVPDSFIPDTPTPLNPAPAESFFERKMREAGVEKTETPGRDVPGIMTLIGKRLQESWPQLTGTAAASMILGGGPISGLLTRAGLGSGVTTALEMLRGTPPAEAGMRGAEFAGGQALGEGIVGGTKALATPIFKAAFDSRSAKLLADHLRKTVPAWSKFEGSMKGLYEMLYSPEGYTALHSMADDAMRAMKDRAQGTGGLLPEVTIPEQTARTFGIKTPQMPEDVRILFQLRPDLRPSDLPAEGTVRVKAIDVLDKVIGQWNKHPGEYQQIMRALDDAGVGDPAFRQAYKTAMGAKDYLDETKAFSGTQYLSEKAQKGLSKTSHVEDLHRRGLKEIYDIVRGPGTDTIKPINQNPWTRKLLGAGIGEAAGYAIGVPPVLSGAAGALGGEFLAPQFKNVPMPKGLGPTPLNIGASGLGELIRQIYDGVIRDE